MATESNPGTYVNISTAISTSSGWILKGSIWRKDQKSGEYVFLNVSFLTGPNIHPVFQRLPATFEKGSKVSINCSMLPGYKITPNVFNGKMSLDISGEAKLLVPLKFRDAEGNSTDVSELEPKKKAVKKPVKEVVEESDEEENDGLPF